MSNMKWNRLQIYGRAVNRVTASQADPVLTKREALMWYSSGKRKASAKDSAIVVNFGQEASGRLDDLAKRCARG